MRTTTEDYVSNLHKVVDAFDEIDREVRSHVSSDIRRIILLGSGANYSQIIPIRHLVHGLSERVDCHIYSGGELERRLPRVVTRDTVVIGMSHSGNTPEIYYALERAGERGATVFGISKSGESGIAQVADFHYAYPSGSNMSEMKLLALNSMVLSILEECRTEGTEELREQLTELPEYMHDAYGAYIPIARSFAENFASQNILYSAASGGAMGPAYAFVISKLMEMQWKDAGVLDSSEFFHGPLEVVDGERAFVLWAAGDALSQHTYRLRDYLSKKGGRFHMIETKGLYDPESPAAREYLSPLLLWPALNVHAWALEEVTGHDLDTRRHMGKGDTAYPWAKD